MIGHEEDKLSMEPVNLRSREAEEIPGETIGEYVSITSKDQLPALSAQALERFGPTQQIPGYQEGLTAFLGVLFDESSVGAVALEENLRCRFITPTLDINFLISSPDIETILNIGGRMGEAAERHIQRPFYQYFSTLDTLVKPFLLHSDVSFLKFFQNRSQDSSTRVLALAEFQRRSLVPIQSL